MLQCLALQVSAAYEVYGALLQIAVVVQIQPNFGVVVAWVGGDVRAALCDWLRKCEGGQSANFSPTSCELLVNFFTAL